MCVRAVERIANPSYKNQRANADGHRDPTDLLAAWLIMGLSRAVHPKVWTEVIAQVKSSRCAGFIMGGFALPIGLLIIVGHNKWVFDWPLFITVCGWGMVIKSAIYFLLPRVADIVIERAGSSERVLRITGIIMAAFGAILTWQAFVGSGS